MMQNIITYIINSVTEQQQAVTTASPAKQSHLAATGCDYAESQTKHELGCQGPFQILSDASKTQCETEFHLL